MKNKTLAKIFSVVTSGVMLFSAGSVYLSHSERNDVGTYNVSAAVPANANETAIINSLLQRSA